MKFAEIALQLVFFMFCSAALGEPWRVILRRYAGLFVDLDFLQALVFDVFLGGFLLYVLAIVPLQLFSAVTLYGVTVVSIALVLAMHRGKLKKFLCESFHHPIQVFRKSSLELKLVALIFVLSFVTQTLPLNDLVLGSVRDTGIHSLFVQVTIENRQIPVTLAPYLGEGIIYPQGFTPLAAYATLLLGYSPPQAVLYITALFNILTVLGAYFLGKTLPRSSQWMGGLSLAFVFAFVASYPKYITWGSNAFVASFPFYFVCLSLFPLLTKGKLNWKNTLAVGLLFGYLSVLHLQVYETLMASLFALWLYVAVRKGRDKWVRFRYFVLVLTISLVVLAPFIARQFLFYSNPYHNIGVPSDVEVPVPQPSMSVLLTTGEWLLENLAIDPLLKVVFSILVFASGVMIIGFRKTDGNAQINELIKIGVATLFGQLLISVLAAISPRDLPFYPQPLMLYVPIYLFVATLGYLLYHHLSTYFARRNAAREGSREIKLTQLSAMALSMILVLAMYAPFLVHSVAFDSGKLYGSYTVFGITTEQDLQLILWIRDNLPDNATVLVSTFQSGTFIPSIAHRRAVFPSFGSSTSASYQKLVDLLEENALNATTVALMKRFNITDVYVGSGVSPWDGGIHKWDPRLFRGNPKFKLLKSFGNAYLFHLNPVQTNITFQDDFEHSAWDESGWQAQQVGNGLGNATVESGSGSNFSRGLRLTARAVCVVSECRYAYCVYRELSVPRSANVSLSFYLNVKGDLHGGDTFAMVVSNVNRNQSIVITTPNGFYEGYANVKSLGGSKGFFNNDLSSLWRGFYNSSLPNTFILEIVNWDFDGVENVVYLDDIAVTAIP